jgi:CRP-like cAMP-binding protein
MLTKDDLKQYSYFSGLSNDALEEIAGKLVQTSVDEGTVIIKQGAPPDYFYFLQEGEVVVKRRNKFGQRSVLNVLSSGQAFGEVAMLTCSHRTCSVLAKSNATLLKLHKKDFEDIILKDAAFKSLLTKNSKDFATYNKMKTFQPFALLSPDKMLILTSKMKERTYYSGETIIQQGEKGDYYYIIKSGSVAVKKEKDGREPQHLADLGEGESFGEEALIRDEKRGASVIAVDETTVLALNEKHFTSILKSEYLDFTFPEDIPLDNVGEYVIIDARIPQEYEEEHIEGAINIPLEVLRQKYKEFEYDNEYVTYCTNDSRGMVAAFLLRSQGYSAKNLRGGLSGWEGPTRVGRDGIHYPQETDKRAFT